MLWKNNNVYVYVEKINNGKKFILIWLICIFLYERIKYKVRFVVREFEEVNKEYVLKICLFVV